jgi:dsRNA-specific ribonuclease
VSGIAGPVSARGTGGSKAAAKAAAAAALLAALARDDPESQKLRGDG